MKKIIKKSGFTLIELLAVIVILAIIAVIATPIVLNIIKNSKVSASQRSAENYLDAVEQAVASKQLDGKAFNPYICTTLDNGNLLCGEETLKVSFNGSKPASGATIKLNKGSVVGISNFKVDGKDILASSLSLEEAIKKICTLKSGEALSIGSEYECNPGDGTNRTFYVLEVTEDNVSLIMDRNIDNTTVAWSSDKSNHKDDSEEIQADVAKAKLTSTTSQWTNVDEVSLPTGGQIANAVNNTTWTQDGEISGLPLWLYGYLSGTNPSVENVYGYWTSTPGSNYYDSVWGVSNYGSLYIDYVGFDNYCGVRPVITVSKSKI